MTSSDVGSFFTNIPLDETINNCVEDLLGSKHVQWEIISK